MLHKADIAFSSI